MITTEYVAFDLETSGLPEEDKKGNKDFSKVCILRVGAAHCVSFQVEKSAAVIKTMDLICKPEPGFTLSPKAMEKNGLTEEQLRDGVPVKEALEQLSDFCRHSCALVGHNIVGFDLPLLRTWIDKENHDARAIVYMDAIDTQAIWKAFSCGLKQQAHERLEEFMARASMWRADCLSNLDHLAMIFLGKEWKRTGPHEAVKDAVLSAQVLEAMRHQGILQEVLR